MEDLAQDAITADSETQEQLTQLGSRAEGGSFHFEPQEIPHVQRAWERVPATAVAGKRKGRTIYKRQIAEEERSQDAADADEEGRGVKRQCLDNLPAVSVQVKNQCQYTPTLREQRPGTPRRKCHFQLKASPNKNIR